MRILLNNRTDRTGFGRALLLPSPPKRGRGEKIAGGGDEGLEVGHRRPPVDAVVEVEDMSPSPAGLQATPRRQGHLFLGPALEQFLVDVALERQMGVLAPGRR